VITTFDPVKSPTARKTLSIAQEKKDYWSNEPMYINGDILGGLIIFGIFVFFLVIAVYIVSTVQTSDHITDAFADSEQARKKKQ
jgi:hypothetical protein